MKYRFNIPALLLSALVLVASNGIAVFEHICNTSQTRNYSVFLKTKCDMEKPVAPCCAKKGIVKKKNCCKHKEFFSKLSIDGFTAKLVELKKVKKELSLKNISAYSFNLLSRYRNNYFSGLSPPDNLYHIKALLQPTPSELQIFRC